MACIRLMRERLNDTWCFSFPGLMIFALTAVLPFAGCDCSSSKGATLSFRAPTEDQRLTIAEDLDSATPGIQFDVRVAATGLAAGEIVSLYLDEDAGIDATPAATVNLDDAGIALFSRVTFTGGEYHIQARARSGGVRSDGRHITVVEECAQIDFVTPSAPADSSRLTLGPGADTDGEQCGATFQTTIVASTDAGDGREATLYVNGARWGTARVAGTVITWRNVVFGNRGTATPNRFEVRVENKDGIECSRAFPAEVYVDCVGSSCTITKPVSDTAFLNQSHDTSDAAGFQSDIEVTTDAEGTSRNVSLIIDGNETDALHSTALPFGGGGRATFGNVDLNEGLRRIQAECTDGAGNKTRSSVAEWTVDVTPCTASISSPTTNQTFIDMDDTDSSIDGIQVQSQGAVAGTNCETVALGVSDDCSTVTGATTLTGTAWSGVVTLSTTPTQQVCALVTDDAGNKGQAQVTVQVRTDAPVVEFQSPAPSTGFNNGGTGGRTADLEPASPTCEAHVVVRCSEVGFNVTLRSVGSVSTLTNGTAPCVETSGLPAPFTGLADFLNVSLPFDNSGNPIAIEARQERERLVGLSTPLSLLSDCDKPILAITRPTPCPFLLRPSGDEQPDTGVQYRIDVLNSTPVPRPPVDLTITAGGSTVYMAQSGATPTQFPLATFSGGANTVNACATDNAGNVGCATACSVNVEDLPVLNITSPAMGAVISASSDCSAGTPGIQMRVQATTDAPIGSAATVQIGASSAVATSVNGSGAIDLCTNVVEGQNLPVVVTVTDAIRGTVQAMTTVNVDTLIPTTAISPLVVSFVDADRRQGRATFSWTAVSDTGGGMLSRYELRCAQSQITNETEWAAATQMTLNTLPASGGTLQSQTVSGFQTGATRCCTLRGYDISNSVTPLAAPGGCTTAPMTSPASSTSVNLPFTAASNMVATGSSRLGLTIAAVGSVNNDSFADVLVGSMDSVSGGKAYLYFGGSSGPATTPSVEITGPSGVFFGRSVAGVGNVCGDSKPDFAVSAQRFAGGGMFRGKVWLFCGRDTWPSTLDVSAASGCGDASACFEGTADGRFIGLSMSAVGDFNSDGTADFAIGGPRLNTTFPGGRVFVVLGGSGLTGRFELPGASPPANEPPGFVIDETNAAIGAFGFGVAPLGNIDGSAGTDLAILSTGTVTPQRFGTVSWVSGRAYPGGASGLQTIATTELKTFLTQDATRNSLFSLLRTIGDYNGDGLVDLALYETSTDGIVYIIQQDTTDAERFEDVYALSPSSRRRIENTLSGDQFDAMGTAVGEMFHPTLGLIGDLDQDNRPDVLLGSNQVGADPSGAADIYYGIPSPPLGRGRNLVPAQLQPGMCVPIDQGVAGTEDDACRRTAAYVGDVNGDGFTDVAVGDESFQSSSGRVIVYY